MIITCMADMERAVLALDAVNVAEVAHNSVSRIEDVTSAEKLAFRAVEMSMLVPHEVMHRRFSI